MRRDRPGYQFRVNRDGSVAHYWNPKRASREFGSEAFRLRLPDDLDGDQIAERCRMLTSELIAGRDVKADRERKRRNVAEQLFKMYRKRARDISKDFDITEQWLFERLASINDRCEVSGVEFNYDPQPRATKKFFKHPQRPSLDRIDNARGYVLGNVRFVLHCVNIGINEWGLDNYVAVCKAVAAHSRGPFSDLSSDDGAFLVSTDW